MRAISQSRKKSKTDLVFCGVYGLDSRSLDFAIWTKRDGIPHFTETLEMLVDYIIVRRHSEALHHAIGISLGEMIIPNGWCSEAYHSDFRSRRFSIPERHSDSQN